MSDKRQIDRTTKQIREFMVSKIKKMRQFESQKKIMLESMCGSWSEFLLKSFAVWHIDQVRERKKVLKVDCDKCLNDGECFATVLKCKGFVPKENKTRYSIKSEPVKLRIVPFL